jgi:saccharopine dehydrogenase-like NADP-dependent oxidoreductase
MTKVVVLGAGKIGITVARVLQDTDDYEVTLADADAKALEIRPHGKIAHQVVDVTDDEALAKMLGGQGAVISALPYFLNLKVAEVARRCGVHYFDPTEDVATARHIRGLADGADTAFVPQCGLAPGFISIAARHLVDRFDDPQDVKLRVGALPQYPDNALRYNLTWSTDGLINEYCNPCETIHEGARRETLPLEGLEHFSLDGVDYEAFSTSGGIGTLCETYDGKVHNLNYKTVRYPGHRDMVKMLADDLNLCERRDVFKDVIEHGVPMTRQDVVVIFVTVRGMKRGLLTQESFVRKIYGDREEDGWSAIQKTTAAAIAAMVDLQREGKLPDTGFVRQEDVDLDIFLANRFGVLYAETGG